MSDAPKKFDLGPILTVPLALGTRAASKGAEGFGDKAKGMAFFASFLESQMVKTLKEKETMLYTALGAVLLFHGAQFKNLFLCTQVILTFCYDRVKDSATSCYSDVSVAYEKMNEETDETKADAKAEAKPDNKHAAKRQAQKDASKPSQEQQEQDAAAAKKLLKALDSAKVADAIREILISVMACHMVMQGGLARAVVVSYALVKASKDQVSNLLEFPGHEDIQAWIDATLSFLLYVFFGGLSLFLPSLALAMNLAVIGAKFVSDNGILVADSMGKIPDGLTAAQFLASVKGLAVFGGLVAFGTLWQLWALAADSGVHWIFKLVYILPLLAENVVSLF